MVGWFVSFFFFEERNDLIFGIIHESLKLVDGMIGGPFYGHFFGTSKCPRGAPFQHSLWGL